MFKYVIFLSESTDYNFFNLIKTVTVLMECQREGSYHSLSSPSLNEVLVLQLSWQVARTDWHLRQSKCKWQETPRPATGDLHKGKWSISQLSHSVVSRLSEIPWTAACQASLSITNSQSLLKPMSIELVMPSSHLILCHLLLLPPSIFPSIRVFSNESVLHIR